MEYEFAPRTKTMTAPIYTKRRRNGSAEGGREALSAMPRNAHTTKQLTRRVLIQLPLRYFLLKLIVNILRRCRCRCRSIFFYF